MLKLRRPGLGLKRRAASLLAWFPLTPIVRFAFPVETSCDIDTLRFDVLEPLTRSFLATTSTEPRLSDAPQAAAAGVSSLMSPYFSSSLISPCKSLMRPCRSLSVLSAAERSFGPLAFRLPIGAGSCTGWKSKAQSGLPHEMLLTELRSFGLSCSGVAIGTCLYSTAPVNLFVEKNLNGVASGILNGPTDIAVAFCTLLPIGRI